MVEKRLLNEKVQRQKTKNRNNKELVIPLVDDPVLKDMSPEWQRFYLGVMNQFKDRK